MYIYKYKDDYIYKGLLHAICLVATNIWVFYSKYVILHQIGIKFW